LDRVLLKQQLASGCTRSAKMALQRPHTSTCPAAFLDDDELRTKTFTKVARRYHQGTQQPRNVVGAPLTRAERSAPASKPTRHSFHHQLSPVTLPRSVLDDVIHTDDHLCSLRCRTQLRHLALKGLANAKFGHVRHGTIAET